VSQLIWSNGRVLRPLSLHVACAVALSERGGVVERHFAILADKDESARKRRVPGGRLKRGQELLTAGEALALAGGSVLGRLLLPGLVLRLPEQGQVTLPETIRKAAEPAERTCLRQRSLRTVPRQGPVDCCDRSQDHHLARFELEGLHRPEEHEQQKHESFDPEEAEVGEPP
jgi:hypothetical protein